MTYLKRCAYYKTALVLFQITPKVNAKFVVESPKFQIFPVLPLFHFRKCSPSLKLHNQYYCSVNLKKGVPEQTDLDKCDHQ